MKERIIHYCKKCGSVKGRGKSKCSNCQRISQIINGEPVDETKKMRKNKKNTQNIFLFRKRKKNETIKHYYSEYIKSKEWKWKRTNIFIKNNNRCRICERKADHVHHWAYNRILGSEENMFLSPLCSECHFLTHKEFKDCLVEMRHCNKRKFKKIKKYIIEEVSLMTNISELDKEYYSIMRSSRECMK